MTGTADPSLAPLDAAMTGFMQARDIPGGALAVVKDGRLVYARGYGWADVENHIPVQPRSLFRIASLSKSITAAAVMTLVQKKRLTLDTPAFALLGLKPFLAPGAHVDPRLWTITIGQLLHHTGGFDSARSPDPMFQPAQIALTLGTPAPPGPADIIRYMMGRPLDFDPGARFAYSNFGYCVLGRVIEKVSGMSYGAYVQKYVLHPLSITDMHLGRTALADAWPGEVHYYQPDHGEVLSVFPSQGQVPYCYGDFNLEAMDSHGGWVASAPGLARFASHVDSLLTPQADADLYAPPPPPAWRDPKTGALQPAFYACGCFVEPVGTGGASNKSHAGSLPGTFSYFVRRADGFTWVALFNHRTESASPADSEIDPLVNNAIDQVKSWPSGDLFAGAGIAAGHAEPMR